MPPIRHVQHDSGLATRPAVSMHEAADPEMVADLGPLATCTGLRRLECWGTQVVLLSPLAACTELVALDCCLEGVPLEQGDVAGGLWQQASVQAGR